MIPQQTLFEWLFNVKCDKCIGEGGRNRGGEKQEFVSATCAVHINQETGGCETMYIPTPRHVDSHGR